MRPWILSEINYGYVKANPYDVAVLPMGATEPHNLHLPYGTDVFEAQAISSRACEAAFSRGAKVVMLPTVPFGTETNQQKFPLSINLNPSTLALVIRDVVASLENTGIKKLLILNSHGGNEFKPVLRELFGKTSVHIFLCDWFRMVGDVYDGIFTRRDDHAGEMETSLALAYFGDLVARDSQTGKFLADDGAVPQSRLQAVNEGWISFTRPWHLLTTNTGSGNPWDATKEKGERLMEVIVERLSTFLVELAGSPIDEKFPFAERA